MKNFGQTGQVIGKPDYSCHFLKVETSLRLQFFNDYFNLGHCSALFWSLVYFILLPLVVNTLQPLEYSRLITQIQAVVNMLNIYAPLESTLKS